MKRIIALTLLFNIMNFSLSQAQTFSGVYTAEWQWDMNKNTNFVNLLRLELNVPLWNGGTFEAATLHVAKTNDGIIDDWQGFSNIEADNMFGGIAVLGYMHEWKAGHVFVGVRNVNEDFFTSDITALFTNSSCGIVPTIASSYPIANYPFSGLTVYFDVQKGGWLFRSITVWDITDGNTVTIRSSYVRRRTASSTWLSWSIRTIVAITLQAWLSIRASSALTMRARWCLLKRQSERPLAPGGCMANRAYGGRRTRTCRSWHSIRRIRPIGADVTGMRRLEALTATASMSVACQDSMHVIIREMNIRWS